MNPDRVLAFAFSLGRTNAKLPMLYQRLSQWVPVRGGSRVLLSHQVSLLAHSLEHESAPVLLASFLDFPFPAEGVV